MAAYISRTLAANNQKLLTISMWVKLAKIQEQDLMTSYYSGSYWASLRFGSDATLRFQDYRTSYLLNLKTNAKYRDLNAWYHIVANFDCSIGSPTAKIYVNGEEPSLSTNTIYSQNATTSWNTDYTFRIGEGSTLGGNDFEGIMSDVYFIQGYKYDASTFGETDATTGEWKPITNPTINYGGTGGNSCHLLFENAANLDLDSGSNNVSFTTNGTLTKTNDCPSHNFATLNKLVRSSGGSFASGNTKFSQSNGSWGSGFGSIGMFNGQGKYYMEFKGVSGTKLAYGISDSKSAGVIDRTEDGENRYCGEYANSYAYHYGGNFYYSGSSTGTGYDTFTSSDVIGMAVDMDNLKIYFHKNGTYQDSKNPASNNGYTIVAPDQAYFPTISVEDASGCVNFGNGIFDTTAISSAGTNASAIGEFEYDVPSGYTALSSKGLNV